jgi:hypothetical protein
MSRRSVACRPVEDGIPNVGPAVALDAANYATGRGPDRAASAVFVGFDSGWVEFDFVDVDDVVWATGASSEAAGAEHDRLRLAGRAIHARAVVHVRVGPKLHAMWDVGGGAVEVTLGVGHSIPFWTGLRLSPGRRGGAAARLSRY